MVTATPTADAPEKVARSTAKPRGPAPTADDLDQRSASPLGVAFAVVVLIVGVLALGAGLRELATRYGRAALLATAVPAIALLSLMLIFTLDGVLPATL